MNASNNSFPEAVENAVVAIEVLADVPSFDTAASLAKLTVTTPCAVKLTPDTFAPAMVTFCDTGVKVYPDFAGVTVYEPLPKFANE